MATEQEHGVVETVFGDVTTRRIKYFAKKGWFGGGVEEDIPLRHVTSVRLETNRYIILSVILGLIGIIAIATGDPIGVLIGLAFLGIAVFLLWGSPKVVVNTAGGDLRPSVGLPWVKGEANRFVQALRDELFKKD